MGVGTFNLHRSRINAARAALPKPPRVLSPVEYESLLASSAKEIVDLKTRNAELEALLATATAPAIESQERRPRR